MIFPFISRLSYYSLGSVGEEAAMGTVMHTIRYVGYHQELVC